MSEINTPTPICDMNTCYSSSDRMYAAPSKSGGSEPFVSGNIARQLEKALTASQQKCAEMEGIKTAKLDEIATSVSCMYCKKIYPRSERDALAEHILTCDKSPLVQEIQALSSERDSLKQRVAFLESKECEAAWCERWKNLCAKNEELKSRLAALEQDGKMLDWLEKFFSGVYNNQHINFPTKPVRLHRDMPDWSIAQGFGTLEIAIGAGDSLRTAIISAMKGETK